MMPVNTSDTSAISNHEGISIEADHHSRPMTFREHMNIVVVGHVDHGKSTVIGRLMADTGSLPEGKLEQVKVRCSQNARPFEYAFLLDALKDEQAQGITIDTARCFFKTPRRDYIIIDAPGHVEFLKNMVTGAARAEAALLVIDAQEGIQENSRRHGYLLSMLGIRQVLVLVNKMDLVGYDLPVFESIRKDYGQFLGGVGITPIDSIPVCATKGENIVTRASWYTGKTVLEHLDSFSREKELNQKPFRCPIQDVYKFTEDQDQRRILAGLVETGSVRLGEQVVFLPSFKQSAIASIEAFSAPVQSVIEAGRATGFTLTDELYIRPGELMCKGSGPLPRISSRFRANLFWMGRAPMIRGRKYKLKLATARASVRLAEILLVLDAVELTTDENKQQVDRHDVAECILETTKPVAFDLFQEIEATGRFVVVDNYEIAGGGIILGSVSDNRSVLLDHVRQREMAWERGEVSNITRETRFQHKSKFIVVNGSSAAANQSIAKMLEKRLFDEGYLSYYLGISNLDHGLDSDVLDTFERREERIRRLGELARILTDSGQIFVTSISDLDAYDRALLKALNEPNEILFVNVGQESSEGQGEVVAVRQNEDVLKAVDRIGLILKRKDIIPDYSI